MEGASLNMLWNAKPKIFTEIWAAKSSYPQMSQSITHWLTIWVGSFYSFHSCWLAPHNKLVVVVAATAASYCRSDCRTEFMTNWTVSLSIPPSTINIDRRRRRLVIIPVRVGDQQFSWFRNDDKDAAPSSGRLWGSVMNRLW